MENALMDTCFMGKDDASHLSVIFCFCHREVLSEIFEMIDLDGNGLLSLDEYNLFELRTSGEKCDWDAWAVCKGSH